MQSSYIESESVDEIEYVGLSYDAFISVKKEVEEEIDATPSERDINNALTLRYFILPNLRGVQYKFFKEVRHG
ncbi:MAG: hypothetical protein KC414_07740 [Romboutsia sp.]|nr:hypothetical protein [Romboutsia sp.]